MKLKAYKYRIYPTKEQEALLNKTFGCVRFVYNKALDIKRSLYQKENKGISGFDLINQMVNWKKTEEMFWLKEVSAQALQSSLQNLDVAYTNFFKKRNRFPKFKNKYSKQSFSNVQYTSIDWNESKVYIIKFKEGIKASFHRKFEGKIKTSTVSKTPTGKYFISILVEENIDSPVKPEKDESKTLGIDLGLKHYLTDSNGDKIENPRHLNKKLKSLKRQQRKLSRKKLGSKNRDKQRKRVARIHEKVTNTRKDFLHKLTTDIAKNQSYTSVAIEDLAVQEMMKDSYIARHIADAGWGTFKEFLTYKCDWYGKNLLAIGRFEPSSKLCTCGYYNHDLKLKDREWACPKCETVHDRDVLAARNIKRFAFCEQNTSKEISVGQELPEFTPLETCENGSLKEEF